jgi:hypothetical protein
LKILILLLAFYSCAHRSVSNENWPELKQNKNHPVLLVHYLAHCPILRQSLAALDSLSQKFPNLQIFFFESGELSEINLFKEATAQWERPAGFISDPQFVRARFLSAKTAGEVFLFAPQKNGHNLAYRGAIDDSASFDIKGRRPRLNYIESSLNSLAEGKVPNPSFVTALGCTLEIP